MTEQKEITVELRVYLAWWVKPYLWCVSAFSVLHNVSPDAAKVQRMIKRGVRIKVI